MLLLPVLGVLGVISAAAAALEGGWEKEYLGSDPAVRFYPDANANYWTYELPRRGGKRHLGLRIDGVFPDARYMSLSVYDNAELSAVASLADAEIRPEPESINPFAAGCTDCPPGRSYRVYVLPQGPDAPPGARNVLRYDDRIGEIAVFLRYYLPRGGPRAGVALPSIRAFDLRSGEEVALPHPRSRLIKAAPLRGMLREQVVDLYARRVLAPVLELNPGEELHAYRISSEGLYANADNDYLVLPLIRGPGEVAVIRFRPPSRPRSRAEIGRSDVRYWSVSLGDAETYNHYTLPDSEARVGADGYVYLVVGDPADADRPGGAYNFLPWEAGRRGVLIYRNLLARPGAGPTMDRVPEYAGGDDRLSHRAEHYLGDYAPQGRLVPLERFRALGTDVLGR
jgi:hypothetical protein